MSRASRYTFGDDDLAARRLAVVASVFEPPSRALLEAATPGDAALAIDLGCGPGHTTRLLAEVGRSHHVLGLDRSDRFVALARSLTTDRHIEFAVHDATEVPLPQAPADVLYARLLLAHLPDPLERVAAWRSQLRPGGVLVLDEVETIETPEAVLGEYLALATDLVATEGASLYAGPVLASLGGACVTHDVGLAVAAHMFAMNLATWREDARRRGLATTARLDRIAEGLDALRSGAEGTVRWVLRHVVLRHVVLAD